MHTLATLPPQSAFSVMTQTIPYSEDGALPQSSLTAPFVMTTATTAWEPPSFPTSNSPPPCTNNICPALNGQTCMDAFGSVYGVLCDQQLTGVAITSLGKKERAREADELDDRSYTGSLNACAASCDQFDKQFCTGVGYRQGVCALYDTILGTVPQTGAIACVRQT
ncbi:hypothetical protein AMS68_004906 [Peltaster fructicola]|uniref:Uncharacterized protein n=1 Tax=Peltaster fructicola TaxID=286661 RepID=A0A6H0XXP0_9PEZI|nr:hypothetical protein AMS68_004906 [Peltaster fructicola]